MTQISHEALLFQLTQVTHWLDLSQIYNSKRSFYTTLNMDPADKAKLRMNVNNPGQETKGVLPSCPPPKQTLTLPPNSCQSCQVSRGNGNRNPGGTDGSLVDCYIGGKGLRVNGRLCISLNNCARERYVLSHHIRKYS